MRVTDEQSEALAQFVEQLSVNTPGTPHQRAYRSRMAWNAMAMRHCVPNSFALDNRISEFREHAELGGLDKELIEAVLALILG